MVHADEDRSGLHLGGGDLLYDGLPLADQDLLQRNPGGIEVVRYIR
jgi:hypothetical protein